MHALKMTKKVTNGKIVLNIPKDFGPFVEIIILANTDNAIEFWHDDEIKSLGKTYTLNKDFDNEDYSKW